MSQRFVRCPHCGTPHDAKAAVCPTTGRRIRTAEPAPRETLPRSPSTGFSSSVPAVLEPLTEEPSLIGQVLGNRYRVLSVLGAGGMGVVYEAEHLGLERHVAVKVLNPIQAKKKNTVKRFQQEARAAGGIGHPNICEVYDMGWLEDGCPYLVMERLHGQNLADRVKKAGGLPFMEVVEVLCQVLAGLMAAHEKGIMHRDIKPENIFLARRTNADPVAKILDFGVSKGMAGGPEEPLDLTRTGMVMGTPYYMSPEQARGERSLDARVDVYACGVMLYECLTGRRPFLAPNYNALLLQILTESPRPARERRPDLPAAFEPILRRAMARARDERYPTAAAMRRDLLHVGKHLQAEAAAAQARAEQAPQQGFPQPGFPQQGFPQPGCPQQGFPQPGFPQQGFPQQGFQAPGYHGQPPAFSPTFAQQAPSPQGAPPQAAQQAPLGRYVQGGAAQPAPQAYAPSAPQGQGPASSGFQPALQQGYGQPPQPYYPHGQPAPFQPQVPQVPQAFARPQAPQAMPPAPAQQPMPPRPAVRPAAGSPARPASIAPPPMAPMAAPPRPSPAPDEPRWQTQRMPPAPSPPSSEQKLRAPFAGSGMPPAAKHPSSGGGAMPAPPKHPSSGGGVASPKHPSSGGGVHSRRPTELDTGPTNEQPRTASKQATAPTLPMGPRPARPVNQDFSDAPTYVISREEILGDYVPPPEPPQPPQSVQQAPASRAPQAASEWDAETTITTAPPEWEQEKEKWEQQDTNHDQPVDPRVQSLRSRIEDDYGDIPVDDATLVRAPLKRPPRR
ncbi:MAG: serine/threonine protein kinase [Myxococcales bacterium]|nr:serine/threonine protein kinase [Myxococcales bacterium]